jgi:hypothetical protein
VETVESCPAAARPLIGAVYTQQESIRPSASSGGKRSPQKAPWRAGRSFGAGARRRAHHLGRLSMKGRLHRVWLAARRRANECRNSLTFVPWLDVTALIAGRWQLV